MLSTGLALGLSLSEPPPVLNPFRSQLRRFQQLPGILLGPSCSKHRAAGYQKLRSCFDHHGDRIVSDAAVNLNPIAQAQFLAKFF
jgi:hypothetical protein